MKKGSICVSNQTVMQCATLSCNFSAADMWKGIFKNIVLQLNKFFCKQIILIYGCGFPIFSEVVVFIIGPRKI